MKNVSLQKSFPFRKIFFFFLNIIQYHSSNMVHLEKNAQLLYFIKVSL